MDAHLAVRIEGAEIEGLTARLTGEAPPSPLPLDAVDALAAELEVLVLAAQLEFLQAQGVDAEIGEHPQLAVPSARSTVQAFGPFQPLAVEGEGGPALCVLLCDDEFPTGVAAAGDGSPIDPAHAEAARAAVCQALGVSGVLAILPTGSAR